MIIDKKINFIIIFLFSFLCIYAQEEHPDCTNPKKIILPLTEEINNLVQDEIDYQPEDKYTYWYKMEVTAACQFSYKLTPISNEDEYELLIYRYGGISFCTDLVTKREKAISNKKEGKIQVKKGETYYFGVLHITGYGCGHQFFIDSENKNATIKAIQHECIEEVLETMLIKEVEQKEASLDTVSKKEIEVVPIIVEKKEVILPKKEKNTLIEGIVVNSNTSKKMEANVVLSSIDGKMQQQINSSATDGFVLTDFSEDAVVVSIKKFGYKTLQDTIAITSDTLKIAIEPIKIGDKLIMHKIYFHPNTYVLKEESKNELEKLCQFMKENSNYSFEIQGHTNGNRNIKKMQQYTHLGEEWNFKGTAKKLSKLRAEKIKAYLIKKGVVETQLQTVGYGGDQMIIDHPKNMQQAMQNIRVEVIVIQ